MTLHKRFANADDLLKRRRPILDMPLSSATVDFELLPFTVGETNEATPDTPPPNLVDLFPDLATYSGPHPQDEENPHRRLDEGLTSSHRVAHTSRIMDLDPVLVSALKPAQNASVNGAWDLHDGMWFEDPKGSTDVPEDIILAASTIFFGRGRMPQNARHAPSVDMPSGQNLRPQHVWRDEEDEMLHHHVQTYRYNWQLVADTFNSEVVGSSTDKPSAYDCWDRWFWKWGGGAGRTKPEPRPGPNSGEMTPGPQTGSHAGTMTPNTARPPPSATPSQQNGGIAIPTLPTPTNGNVNVNWDRMTEPAPPPPGMSKREARLLGGTSTRGRRNPFGIRYSTTLCAGCLVGGSRTSRKGAVSDTNGP